MASREGVLSQGQEAESVLVLQRGESAGGQCGCAQVRSLPAARGEEGPAGACLRPPCLFPPSPLQAPPRSPGCRRSPFQSGLSDGSLPSKGHHLGPTASTHRTPQRPLSQLLHAA